MRTHVIVGGGIAGVCCAETLCPLCPADEVVLVTASVSLKGVANVERITQHLETFDVVEKRLDELPHRNLRVVHGEVDDHDVGGRTVTVRGERIKYDRLCVATGARPKELLSHPHALVLRDTESILALAKRLKSARRIIIAGNGGIALELAGTLRGIMSGGQVLWVTKHGHIGDAFFDVDAADFLLSRYVSAGKEEVPAHTSGASDQAGVDDDTTRDQASSSRRSYGHAVGPTWSAVMAAAAGRRRVPSDGTSADLVIETGKTIRRAIPADELDVEEREAAWNVVVELSCGSRVGADEVVCACGVEPCSQWASDELRRGDDGGILVDNRLQTNISGIFAAGDACTAVFGRPHGDMSNWFQMRLWSQARSMGMYAAQSMAGVLDELTLGLPFELFTHVTQFCGMKVVLLGLYNGQGLENEPEGDVVMYTRDDRHGEPSFVRVLLLRGRLQGAVLIGETGLEETFENLILNRLDVTQLGADILHPEVDDVFD